MEPELLSVSPLEKLLARKQVNVTLCVQTGIEVISSFGPRGVGEVSLKVAFDTEISKFTKILKSHSPFSTCSQHKRLISYVGFKRFSSLNQRLCDIGFCTLFLQLR